MGRKQVNRNVFQAAMDRIYRVYKEGHRVVVACSGGKDSGVVVELSVEAAKTAHRLPVEIMFRDDEILFPGTHEYMMRLAERSKEIKVHWMINCQAEPNIFNRANPFWWAFDWKLQPSEWVSQPPDFADWDLSNINLYYLINANKFPPPAGHQLFSIVGIRTQESKNRLFAIQSSKGAKSFASADPRVVMLYPIYDWSTGDVWKAVSDNGWDYNHAYDILSKMGVPAQRQRLSQIAMSTTGLETLRVASRAWPRWFDKVCDRLPGIRNVVYYGKSALIPIRHEQDTWRQTFIRSCIETAPEWIKERSAKVLTYYEALHAKHSDKPFPDVGECRVCKYSWKHLAEIMYSGDPYCIYITWLPYLEPKDFRAEETRIWPKSHKWVKKADIKI